MLIFRAWATCTWMFMGSSSDELFLWKQISKTVIRILAVPQDCRAGEHVTCKRARQTRSLARINTKMKIPVVDLNIGEIFCIFHLPWSSTFWTSSNEFFPLSFIMVWQWKAAIHNKISRIMYQYRPVKSVLTVVWTTELDIISGSSSLKCQTSPIIKNRPWENDL